MMKLSRTAATSTITWGEKPWHFSFIVLYWQQIIHNKTDILFHLIIGYYNSKKPNTSKQEDKELFPVWELDPGKSPMSRAMCSRRDFFPADIPGGFSHDIQQPNGARLILKLKKKKIKKRKAQIVTSTDNAIRLWMDRQEQSCNSQLFLFKNYW